LQAGYQQLGQPERWSSSLIQHFHWHLDAFLLSIALERVTVERFMLARVVAAAQFRDEPQNLLEHLPCDGDLGHLEDDITAVAPHLRADLDQLVLQGRQRPVLDRLRRRLFLGTLLDPLGNPITNAGLWALRSGTGESGFDPNALYFDAGINGEVDGLFGEIQVAPSSVPGPHRGCGTAWPDLGERWSSRLVATAAEKRLTVILAASRPIGVCKLQTAALIFSRRSARRSRLGRASRPLSRLFSPQPGDARHRLLTLAAKA
jgi:hypothetical protein